MEQKKDPRKDFRKRSSQFFSLGLVVAFSLTLVAFEWRTSEYVVLDLPVSPTVDFIDDEPPIRIFVNKPAPKLVPPKVKLKPAPVPNPDPTPSSEPNPAVIDPVVDSVQYVDFKEEPEVPEYVHPVKWAERMPEFVGGESALRDYLRKNLKYPKLAARMNVEAQLYVQFVVNRDGSVSDVEVMRSEGFGFDQEAYRVINEMPNWIPGMQGGKRVRVIYIIPINFSLLK